MAELSQVLGFLTIFKDSFKIILKNGKFMGPITLLSLLMPSILLLLFNFIYQTLMNSITKSLENDPSNRPTIAYISLLLVFKISCIIAYVKISHISGIATIIVSATSHTNTKISTHDLYSRIITTTWRSSVFGFRTPSNRGTGVVVMLVWMLFIFMAFFYPNPVTIPITVLVSVSVFVFQLYASVGTVLSQVVSVVEEKFEGSEVLEKAEELIKGQRHHGFMINLFFSLMVLIMILGCWLALSVRLWSVNVTEVGLFLVIYLSLSKMYGCVAYTVFYFQCKKYHGEEEEIGVVGNFDYSKLPVSELDGGIL